ncbi:MAG: radical SAM protein [Calditrichia bacterium]
MLANEGDLMHSGIRVSTQEKLSRTDIDSVDCSSLIATNQRSNSAENLDWDKQYVRNFDSLELDNGDVVCYNGQNAPALLCSKVFEILTAFETPSSINQIFKSDAGSFRIKEFGEMVESFISLGLILPLNRIVPRPNEVIDKLTAWLHITDVCNLSCSYCYLPHNPVTMSIATGKGIIDSVFRSASEQGLEKIQLKYAGGEAMLKLPIICALQKYAMELAAKHDVQLESVVLSNGTLINSSVIEELKKLNLHITISLDGLGPLHDQQRHHANGKGSFAKVVDGIALLVAHGIKPFIAVTISSNNVDGLAELTEWLLRHDLPFKFSLYRDNAFAKSTHELMLDEKKIIAGLRAAYKVIELNLPKKCLLNSLLDRSSLSEPQLRSCGAGENYMVFDYKGNVSKCQMQMNVSVTDFRSRDLLEELQSSEKGVINLSVDEREGCRDCKWKYWCGGGCPALTYRATGRYDIKSPNCNIYKALYPEVVRLEGLRLQLFS